MRVLEELRRSLWLQARVVLLLMLSVSCGCLTTATTAQLPLEHQFTREPLIIYSNFSLPRRHRLFNELVSRRDDVTEILGLPPSDEPIHIYLFDSFENYQTYLDHRFPDFPDRRAFFVETDTTLAVYAYWGDRIAEDLRHEVAHGYLHAVVSGLPLWLDEGLAEYFEVPRSSDGKNDRHIRKLLKSKKEGKWNPNLRRLETLTDPDQMSQQDYAESWAWVHWLLESSPKHRRLLRQHLARLRVTGSAPPLSHTIAEQILQPQDLLNTWLELFADEQISAPDK